MSSDSTEISQLAKVLHQNGDKVLNALSKLSLNAVLLQKLNKEFKRFIDNGIDNETLFQVVLSNNGSSQLLNDLHFLHDFIQKTVGLKLTNSPSLSLLNDKIDISKFKSIKYLEIKKIPIREVIGLKNFQSQLESIVCIRCLSMLEELLAGCGGDNSSGFVWSELREAVLSFNNIKVVDTSVAFAPWLQVLDLSHNQITDVKAIGCLPNLKYVNLSFNCLDVIPTFNKSARKKIELLVLKNNYIEDLSGLQGLCHLTELDLSNNWVSSTDSLDPILSMSALQWLSLSGNPISFHHNYRRNVAGYLHISASFSDFYLDKIRLSKKEKAIVGIKLCSGNASLNKTQIERISSSLRSKSSVEEDKNEPQTGTSRKSGKARLVVIPNLDDGTYEEAPSGLNDSCLITSSTEHLITKKRIENTRSTYGIDNWLVQGSLVVQDILGLPPVEIPTSTPFDDLCLQAALESAKNIVTTTAVIETQQEPEGSPDKGNKESFFTCNDNDTTASNYFSLEPSGEKTETEGSRGEEQPEPMKESSPDTEESEDLAEVEIGRYDKAGSTICTGIRANLKKVIFSADENQKLYVALREVKTFQNEIKIEELFLTVTDTELQEREPIKGKIVTKWSLSLIESCVKLKPNQLQFFFDTVRRDKKERTYSLEEQEAHTLYKQIAEILESRTLSDMNQIVYKCENCSSQFSTEMKSRKSELNMWCPFCNSKFILQLDEVPFPSSAEEKKKNGLVNSKNSDVKVSHNRSLSTGGQKDEKILKCASHSSIGSAASLDELNELPTIHSANVKRSDSDIEILSNPSQSSIEVIDGPGRNSTPNRKKSSEERQTVEPVSVAAAANLIQGINLTGLTESSSSGSITDSICTAYENISSNTALENKTVDGNAVTEESGKKCPSLTGDSLLQGVITNIRRELKNLKSADLVEYSYTDFTNIDHRIKLFLYTHVFEETTEEFCFGFRAVVLPSSSSISFPSCVVASNKKLYFLKITQFERGDDASTFLQKNDSLSFHLSAVKSVYTLTWHQGFGIKIQLTGNKSKEFLILFKDPSRTQNFLEFLTSRENCGLCNAEIIKETLERPYLALQHLLLTFPNLDDSSIQYFCLFDTCSIISSQAIKEITAGGLLTNNMELLLFSGSLNWLLDNGGQPPNPTNCQKFSNLVQIFADQIRIVLQFYDGIDEREVWFVKMETQNSTESLLNTIRETWETLFSVPLQLSSI